MAKYECSYRRGTYPKGAGAVIFECMTEPVGLTPTGEKIFYGVFDSNNESMLKSMPGETTKTLDEFIQGQDDFKNHVVGVKGIWLESERLGELAQKQQETGKMEYLKGLGREFLRRMLALAGIAVPLNAGVEELAALASNIDAAPVTPAPAVPPSSPALPPVAETTATVPPAAAPVLPEIPPNPEDEAHAPAEASVATNSAMAVVVTAKGGRGKR